MSQLSGLVLNILWAFWGYKEAAKNEKNGPLWAVLCFLFGLLPLGILHIKVGKKAYGITMIVIWGVVVLIALFVIVALAASGQ